MHFRTRVFSRGVSLCAALGALAWVLAGGAPGVAAQAGPVPATAVLTRWDIFAATGGMSTTSTNATRNPNGIARNPLDGTVWFTAQRPTLRLGWLNPASNSYVEWSPLATSAAPLGVALHPSSGDVWITTGADPEVLLKIGGANTFRRFELPTLGSTTSTKTHRLAVTADGSAAFVSVPLNGALNGILRITRGADDLGVARGTPVSVAAEHWRLTNQQDNPRHVTLDGRDIVWFTNARDNTLYRLDPATNQFKRWILAAGTAPAGIHITNGADGFAQTVCVVSEGNPAASTGVVQCMNTAPNALGGNDFSVFTRPTSLAFAFPQQVAANAAGELFLSEKHNDALTFIDDTAQARVTVVSRPAASGTLPKTTPSVNVSDPADVTPVALTVTPTVTAVVGVEDPMGPAGHVRFTLPALPPVFGSLLSRNARPIGVTAVVESAGGAPGAVFVTESFDVTNAEQQMGGVISRFAPGESATVIQATPTMLTFEMEVGAPADATQLIAIEQLGGGAASWTAAKTQPWLALSPSSGDTPSTLTVSASAGSLAAGTYTDTITISGGTNVVSVPVTLNLTVKPTMVVTPSLLSFTAVNTDATPPPSKTFEISSEGEGTLEWTATASLPGVEVLLEVPGQPRQASIFGSGPAVVTVHIGTVPGVAGLREGAVTITSSNATNPSATVVLEYEITSVTQALVVDTPVLAFDAVWGGPSPMPQVVNVTNASGMAVAWGVIPPFNEAPQPPSWVQVSPQVATTLPKLSTPMTVTVDTSGLEPGTFAATITIDDHTGNSPPATVEVLVTVRAAAIQFVEDTLTIQTNTEADPSSQTVTLTNPGNAPLVFTPAVSMNTGAGWLIVTPAGEQTLEPGGSLPLTVTTTPAGLAPGTYTGQIAVANPFSVNGSDVVIVTMVVDDATPPVISGAVGVTVEATGASGAVVDYTLPTAIDAHDGDRTVSCTPPPGSTFPLGATTVTCSASDAAGNTATAPLTVTVQDTTPPAFSGGADVTVQAPHVSGAAVTYTSPTASDLVDGAVEVSCAPASGSTFPIGDTTVTCTASDTRDNADSTSFVVTVTPPADTTPPSITAPANQTVEAEGPSGATTIFEATATDDSGAPSIVYSQESGSTFPLGTTTVTVTATDGTGNTATAGFTITVVDTAPPEMSGATPITLEATSLSGAVVTFAPTASDLVSGSRPVTCTPASGATFPVGGTTVVCISSDDAGNTSTVSFLVTVTPPPDTTPPVIAVPANQLLEATSAAGAVATFSATATDDSGAAPTITYSHVSGSTFPFGVTTVTVTARDAAENTASATFAITVRDTIAPSLHDVPANFTIQTNQHSAVVTYTMPTATDIADATPSVVCAPAPGSSLPANATHTITCTATDDSGNVSSQSFQVTVQQNTPYVLFPDDLHFKTGRLAYCNGLPVGPSWKTTGVLVINRTSSHLPYTVTEATSWVRVQPSSGTIRGSFGTILIVSVNRAGLGRGIHQGFFTFTAGGVSTVVPVTLEIGNARPTLCVTPTAVEWGTVRRGETLTQFFDVQNVGDDPLGHWKAWKAITEGTLTLSTTGGTGPGQIGVTVKTGRKKGHQAGQVRIVAPGADNGVQTINLSWTVR